MDSAANYFRHARTLELPERVFTAINSPAASPEVEGPNQPASPPSSSGKIATEKLYLADTYLFTLDGARAVSAVEDTSIRVVLNKTIFHPQGGGQPADMGTISTEDGAVEVAVSMVKEDRATGIVEHTVTVVRGSLAQLLAAPSLVLKVRLRPCSALIGPTPRQCLSPLN